MNNKKDPQDDNDDYYKKFNFLNSASPNINPNSNNKNIQRPKNYITIDQRNSNPDINTGIEFAMTSEIDNDNTDGMIYKKPEGKKAIESKELNKRLRTKIEYQESLKNKDNSKMLKEVHDIEKLISSSGSGEEFKVSKFKDDNEKNKVLFNAFKRYYHYVDKKSKKNEKKEEKVKIIRVKKKKVLNNSIDDSKSNQTNENKQTIQTNQNKIESVPIDNLSVTNDYSIVNQSDNKMKYLYYSIMFSSVFLVTFLAFRKSKYSKRL